MWNHSESHVPSKKARQPEIRLRSGVRGSDMWTIFIFPALILATRSLSDVPNLERPVLGECLTDWTFATRWIGIVSRAIPQGHPSCRAGPPSTPKGDGLLRQRPLRAVGLLLRVAVVRARPLPPHAPRGEVVSAAALLLTRSTLAVAKSSLPFPLSVVALPEA